VVWWAAFRQRARRPAALQQQAHLQAAFHPDVREVSLSRHRARALPTEPALAPVLPQPAERQDVREAWRRAPALRSGQETETETPSGGATAQRASASALPPGPALSWAQAAPQGLRTAVWLRPAEMSGWAPDASVLPWAPGGALSEHAAAEPAGVAEAVSAHAAAGPRPEAASAPWVRQAVEAAEVPDGSRAAAEVEAAAPGVSAQQPEEAGRADAAAQPQGAVRPVPWAQQVAAAAVAVVAVVAPPGARRAAPAAPSALPSEAASVFRQGLILAGPARPRAAARFARAMRSLRIASRSGPSWQAARNEGWSCREIPRKVL
jgi:hypothetical protein